MHVCTLIQGVFLTGTPLKVPSTKKLIQARLGVSRTIYVNVDSPDPGFPYFNFLGGYQWKKHPVYLGQKLKTERTFWGTIPLSTTTRVATKFCGVLIHFNSIAGENLTLCSFLLSPPPSRWMTSQAKFVCPTQVKMLPWINIEKKLVSELFNQNTLWKNWTLHVDLDLDSN